jgi:hypothetical protein
MPYVCLSPHFLARAAMTTQIANKAADCAAFKLNGVKACTAAAGNNMVQVCVCVMRARAPLAIHPRFLSSRCFQFSPYLSFHLSAYLYPLYLYFTELEAACECAGSTV